MNFTNTQSIVKMLTAKLFIAQKTAMCAPKRSETPTKHWLCKKGSSQGPIQRSRRYVNASANPLICCYSELKNKMRSKILFWGMPKCLFSYYQNAFWEIFGFCFATSHPLDTLLTSLPGPGRCLAHQQKHQLPCLKPKPDWRRGTEGLVGGAMWSVSGKLRESGFGLSVTFHQGQSWEVTRFYQRF